ncbi:glutathione S-transferase [Gonapodya prolifera JEL478]|uniref:Glutathione S-transferase n=1 Tax=Gonapodya prolifera (strain JEL478) TaxID=1344416 RepID=A0A139A4E9_GONPJ|nr:glutathione S-transferase [Gonapodya prolifera JEL478]|eukprot:KXS11468.1 glutathione S-transferase [Gonapodya prolifera JEL478]
MSAPELTVYGLDVSQPCRTVTWLLRLHDVPFKYKMVMPGSKKKGGSRTPEYEDELYSAGTVPTIRDGDIVVAESGAIITYLAETRGWDDVYPSGPGRENAAKRAEVQKWLHWHHLNSRTLTSAYFAPIMRPDLKFSADTLNDRKRQSGAALKILDKHLSKYKFLATFSDKPSLADFAVHADVGQLQLVELFDFTPYPNVSRWLDDMKTVKGFEESHKALMGVRPMIEKGKKALAGKL